MLKTRLLDPAGLRDSGLGLPQASDDNFARPHAELDGTLRVIAPRAVDNIARRRRLQQRARSGALAALAAGPRQAGRAAACPRGGNFRHAVAADAGRAGAVAAGAVSREPLRPRAWASCCRTIAASWSPGDGGIDGTSCSLAIVPGRGLGVAVLANVPWTGLPEGLLFHIIDRALGVRGRDFSALRLALSLSSRARHAEGLRNQLGPQVSTAFPVPRTRLVGRYHSPPLGTR